ncbi:HAD family hydrolase [Paenibacillus sp. GSMTC-2017]|nr:HAD family hydrolase [Paenibacillus sp. GSMTC-2017]
MDNTLLRSNIDFSSMKNDTFQFLVSKGIVSKEINIAEQTTSTIIDSAIRSNLMTEALIKEMWDIPKKYEINGMKDAVLEKGAKELLMELQEDFHLVVVTNNSVHAAEKALQENHIFHYFDCLVGREMMNTLKPASDGFNYVLNQYKTTSPEEWISVGDSWIDGKASMAAGILFISYNGDAEKMDKMDIRPTARIQELREIINFLK